MAAGRTIFLNGAPSVGKSSTARALHELVSEPYFYLGLDEFCAGYRKPVWLSDDGTMFHRMVNAYLHTLAMMAQLGHNVIAESTMTARNERLYLDLFASLPVTFIGLRCSLEIAQARESARNDRDHGPMNLDRPEFYSIHDHGCYDAMLDTSFITPRQVAERILPVVASPPRPSAFERLRAGGE